MECKKFEINNVADIIKFHRMPQVILYMCFTNKQAIFIHLETIHYNVDLLLNK